MSIYTEFSVVDEYKLFNSLVDVSNNHFRFSGHAHRSIIEPIREALSILYKSPSFMINKEKSFKFITSCFAQLTIASIESDEMIKLLQELFDTGIMDTIPKDSDLIKRLFYIIFNRGLTQVIHNNDSSKGNLETIKFLIAKKKTGINFTFNIANRRVAQEYFYKKEAKSDNLNILFLLLDGYLSACEPVCSYDKNIDNRKRNNIIKYMKFFIEKGVNPTGLLNRLNHIKADFRKKHKSLINDLEILLINNK